MPRVLGAGEIPNLALLGSIPRRGAWPRSRPRMALVRAFCHLGQSLEGLTLDVNVIANHTQGDNPAGSIPEPSSILDAKEPTGYRNRCWRTALAVIQSYGAPAREACGVRSTSATGLCDDHLEEMRSW